MDDLIVKTITRLITPFIQLYGIFIILHGHLSPGGGFSGGSILGASIILYSLSFGLEKASKKLSHDTSAVIETGGILWYVALGFVGIFTGGYFLTNRAAGFPMGETGKVISSGMIALITLGIGAKVASTMITLFHTIVKED